MRRMPGVRELAIGVALLVGVGACGVSVKEAGSKALADAAEGSWDCRSQDEGEALKIGDETFEVGSGEDAAEGTWKIVDRNLEIRVGKNLAKILDFDGLGLDVGTITIEFPYSGRKDKAPKSGVELHEFSIEVTGTDKAVITPVGKLATKRWPSAPFTCTRAD